jgi:primosomal protein N' (replication factor Y)
MKETLADIVILSGIPKRLTYNVPQSRDVEIGSRVVVPLKGTKKVGVVVSNYQGLREGLKNISALLDDRPLINQELIDLLLWCAKYYHTNIGSTVALAFPPYLRQAKTVRPHANPVLAKTHTGTGRLGKNQLLLIEAIPEEGISLDKIKKLFPGSTGTVSSLVRKGFVKLIEEQSLTPDLHESVIEIDYTDDQENAIIELSDSLSSRQFKTFILHGITGSGKTEVYLACARQALQAGLSVLYLVPEIALTPQSIAMIQHRIPSEIALFHSGLSPKARCDEFMKVSSGKVNFVLGTRSAVFAPLTKLGLIIVDEEHDHSYKQEDGVPYNARDLAIMRAKNNNALVILGSATPSMETFCKAGSASTRLITMTRRTGDAALPNIEIVDMRGTQGPLSEKLLNAIDETLSKKEQVLLFINRRGFSSALVCPGCGRTLNCTHCDRSLTYHKSRGVALCHYCGFSFHLPEICPSCGCMDMKPIGMGTEQIMQSVGEHIPDARILKMDSDEITSTKKLSSALQSIRNQEIDIIIGTQMIAKGHDFPHLTLVGVMHAEQLLFMPDFRAGERTFQQIVQVAGRAGRRMSNTDVLIQTLIPDHPLITSIADYDYEAMIAAEEEIRRASGFPPFVYMARCIFSSTHNETVQQMIHHVAAKIEKHRVDILGPAPAPISLLRNYFRWHILLRSKDRTLLHRAIESVMRMNIPSGVKCKIDVDPYTML